MRVRTMKFFHLADLHIGKRVHGYSMLKDQESVFSQIIKLAAAERPDAVLIAGDIYDKSVPAAEGVTVFDDFLTKLYHRGIPVCLVSGNHDSPERLNYGARILKEQQIHVAGLYRGETPVVRFADEYGDVNVYLLPFIRPSAVRPYLEDPDCVRTYDDAVREAVRRMEVDPSARNVLVAHQFVTGGGCLPETSDSEEASVGTLDEVDASAFSDFDYVALGHIHGPQWIARPTVRYAGSPLPYSFSEAGQEKSVTVLELGKKGDVQLSFRPLRPLHGMRKITGPIGELTDPSVADLGDREDYIHATLTDTGEVYDALGRMRSVYPNLMQLVFAGADEESGETYAAMEEMSALTPTELFAKFYEMRRQKELEPESRQIIEDLFREIREEESGA